MQKLIQSLAWSVTFLSLTAMAGENVDSEIAAKDNSRVSIDNMRGKVEIIGWQQNKVKVSGEIDDEAEKFVLQDNGNHIEVLVLMPKKKGNHRWQGKGSDLTIYVPFASHVKFTGISTDVEVSNINKSLEVMTVSGDIEAENIKDNIELVTVSGRIKTDSISGRIQLSTVSGDIVDKASEGRLYLKSVSGDIKCDSKATDIEGSVVSGSADLTLEKVDDIAVNSVSGKLNVELGLNANATTKLSSVSGAINLTLADDSEASFDVNANAGGRIVNDLTSDKVITAKYGPGSKLYFEKGQSGALVKISTLSGRIKISD